MTPTERATNLVNVWEDFHRLALSPRARADLIERIRLAQEEAVAQEMGRTWEGHYRRSLLQNPSTFVHTSRDGGQTWQLEPSPPEVILG